MLCFLVAVVVMVIRLAWRLGDILSIFLVLGLQACTSMLCRGLVLKFYHSHMYSEPHHTHVCDNVEIVFCCCFEAEARGITEFKTSLVYIENSGYPGPHSETLSQKQSRESL